MKKSNNKLVAKVVVAVSVLSIIGVLAQQVEKELDKEEVKAYVQENFKEDDNNEEHINFENDNQDEDSFLEYIGF